MKKLLILVCVLVLATGCSSGGKKRFTLIVDPPDADIIVITGGGRPEQKYHSPADITVDIPDNPGEAARGRLEIRREKYKPMSIILNSIQADTLKLKLSRLSYKLKFRMTRPALSDQLMYRDKTLAIRLTPGERRFNLSIKNFAQKPISILWQQSEYTDYRFRAHRIIPSGVNPEHRNQAIRAQEIQAGGSLEQTFVPVDHITYSSEKKSYESRPLFSLENDGAPLLKGKSFSLFLPIEVDRAIIPDYNFQFEIVDVVEP
jgi:hypothetical protein